MDHFVNAILLVVLLLLLSSQTYIHAEGAENVDDCPPDGALNEEGVCLNTVTTTTTTTPICPLWDVNDGWILSGNAINRYDIVPGLVSDIMIPWKQHSVRSFPRWGRHHHFFRHPTNTESSSASDYIFAPGYKYPLECHKHHANLAVNYTDVFLNAFAMSNNNNNNNAVVTLNPPIRTDRTIAIGDPLFLPCIDPTLSAYEEYDQFPDGGMTTAELVEAGDHCINKYNIFIQEMETGNTDTISEKYFGTFTKNDISEGRSILWGVFVPMHRSELHNPLGA